MIMILIREACRQAASLLVRENLTLSRLRPPVYMPTGVTNFVFHGWEGLQFCKQLLDSIKLVSQVIWEARRQARDAYV
jgi:hypothetical protein